MICLGVLAGTTRPCQLSPVTSGYPSSVVVGRFGSACERVLLVTARPRNLPSITWCAAGDGEAKHICVCPPTAEPTARPALLKGTCTRSRQRERRNVSPTRCPGVPVPGDA